MNISGETMIFKNDRGYSTTISNKKEDGSYENMFIPVNFRKGIELLNKTKINVINGFLSFYKTKDGLAKVKMVITDFEQNESNEYEITDSSELPFWWR